VSDYRTLKLREGYKTLVLIRLPDGSLRLTTHRPPHTWLDFVITAEQAADLRIWLDGDKND
jgi:hypothetical protein